MSASAKLPDEYKETTCDVLGQSGPHHVKCKYASATSPNNTAMLNTHVMKHKHGENQHDDCGTTYCIYRLRSKLTGNKQFDADGNADAFRCTELPASVNQTACWAEIKDDEVKALVIRSEGRPCLDPD